MVSGAAHHCVIVVVRNMARRQVAETTRQAGPGAGGGRGETQAGVLQAGGRYSPGRCRQAGGSGGGLSGTSRQAGRQNQQARQAGRQQTAGKETNGRNCRT